MNDTEPAQSPKPDKQPGIFRRFFRWVLALFTRAGHWLRAVFFRVYPFLEQRILLALFILSVLIVFFVEALSRHSLLSAFLFPFRHPVYYILNLLIVMTTLMPALLCKRRLFYTGLLSAVWFILGLANCIVLVFRTTPLAAVDFKIFNTALQVIDYYLTVFHYVFIIAVLAAVVLFCIVLWKRAPKRKPRYRLAVLCLAVALGITLPATITSTRAVATNNGFSNLVYAYDRYGFAYCFTFGIFDSGIDKPSEYSETSIQRILEQIENAESAPKTQINANIIYLQLESFYDVHYVDGVEYSQNPLPVFTALKEQYPSGMLRVPSVGAGTANTEFELITGMRLAFFGASEYPYKTILKKNTCESACVYLRDLGYAVTAMHNNNGLFYERNTVFRNLNFDRYISLEYMQNAEFNSNGWAKDRILTQEILKTLDASDQPDFVYAISVQGHGKYLVDAESLHGPIFLHGITDKDARAEFTYYINELYEMDQFLGELTAALAERDEPTVLVIYGDHLPTLSALTPDVITAGDIYTTEYVLWSNFALDAEDQDIEAYQLMAYVHDLLGIRGDIVQRLHTVRDKLNTDDYFKMLHALQYDLIYGARYAAGGTPLAPSDMVMGWGDAIISDVQYDGENIIVTGGPFTPYCYISINGKFVETRWIDENTLIAELTPLARNDQVQVIFAGSNQVVLSETSLFVY